MPAGRYKRRRLAPPGKRHGHSHLEDSEASVRFIQSSSEDSDDEREDYPSSCWLKRRPTSMTVTAPTNSKPEYQTFSAEDDDEEFKKKKTGCSRAEKQLSILVIVCFILLVAMAALIVINYIVGNPGTCDTPECVTTSAEIIRNMDLSADPCNDFYQYSCGHFTVNQDIPPDKAQWTMFSAMQQHNYVQIKQLLESPNDNFHDHHSEAIAKAKAYYHDCMNTTVVEEKKSAPALYLLRELGGWTMASSVITGQMKAGEWHLHNALIQAVYHGVSPFFSLGVGPDDKDSSKNIMSFDQGGLSYSNREFYIGNNTEKYHDALVHYIARVGELLTADPQVAKESAENIWQLEKKLAEIMVPREERQDTRKIYHKMTLYDLDGQIGYNIDLQYIINELYQIFHPKLHIKPEEPVINYSPQYFKQLGKIIGSTKNGTLADYIAWRLISSIISDLSMEFRQAQNDFSRELLGVASEDPQWKKCVGRTSGALGFAVGAMFVQDTYTDQERDEAHLLIKRIRETFIARLPSVSWMDQETKALAAEKARLVIEKIGYPAELFESAATLDEYYAKLNVTGDPFDNVMQVRFFFLCLMLDKRDIEVNRAEWQMTPETVNAYYNPANNEIVFPAGILQKPFYDLSYPMSWNFGAIGMVMGHELSHGFDNMGRLYDKYGNLQDWWTNSSAEGFLDHAQCLEDQYGQYKAAGVNVNGKTTLGENIADNGGLRTSYLAYQTWLRENGMSDASYSLPGLHLTNDQLFFVGFAQVWCDYVKPEEAQTLVITDVHSPAKVRVFGTVSNMKEFADAFECKADAAMNPEQKCSVW